MIKHKTITAVILRSKIRNNEIIFAGNSKLKIYGLLSCSSGKRMLKKNRVFFELETVALENGYRPSGHCLKHKYKNWKDGPVL